MAGISLPQGSLQATPALQLGGFQSQPQFVSQPLGPGSFTSPTQQVPQSFVSPGYTSIQTGFTPTTQLQSSLFTPGSSAFHANYSELTGQPTPSQTIALTTTLEVSTPETTVAPVTGTETTEMIPSFVASTEPP
jgi:hypothetical protein